jgi:hypothetical protein
MSHDIIFQHPVALVSSTYVCVSPSQVQLLFSLVFMCTLVLVLVQHVSAVRHLQVLCFYLLAETAALLCFVFICPHNCLFNIG